MTPYFTAWIALFGWPLVAAALYRRFDLPLATAITLIGGYLILPERVEIDLPVLPALNKDTIPAISAFVLLMIAARDPAKANAMQPGWLPKDKIALGLLVLLIVGAFGTALTNMDGVRNGGAWQPGMRVYDGFSIAMTLSMIVLPFLIARKILASYEAQKTLAFFLVAVATVYAFLALYEIRMSPQLNNMVYGFFPHSWIQHKRGGGWRPIIFLQHGLWVGIFFCCATIIAFGLVRHLTGQLRTKVLAAGIWLLFTIALCKVLGAFTLTLLFVPVVLFLPLRMQLLAAFSIAVAVMSYPTLRHIDAVPTERILVWAKGVDPLRAKSLEFRFINEDRLLDRAKKRPVFGWGGWGRNRVFNEQGKDISVTDGRWIILFGQGGWVRYIAEFGLLLLVAFRLPFAARDKLDPIAVALSMALVANMIDCLPNGGVSVLTWVLAGALVGRLELAKTTVAADSPATVIQDEPQTGRSQYARDFSSAKPGTHSRATAPPGQKAELSYGRQPEALRQKRPRSRNPFSRDLRHGR